jgi:hypothetical protein
MWVSLLYYSAFKEDFMQPLDLRVSPPRSPREKLGGLYMLGRTIDKLRANLPGGNMGTFHVFFGMSKILADQLGIDLQDLAVVVRDAESEQQIVDWVRRQSDPSKYEAINAALSERTQTHHIPPEHRERFDALYAPELRAEYDNLFDLVEADDRRCFAAQ